MSLAEMDQVFPLFKSSFSSQELAQNISAALRRDCGGTRHAIKRLSKQLNVKPRTVKNWYEARNTPSLLHLLQLARVSSSLAGFLLEQIGGADLRRTFERTQKKNERVRRRLEMEKGANIYRSTFKISRSTFLTLNPGRNPKKPNRRQAWFLEMLRCGKRLKAEDLAAACDVSRSTAKSDIAGLVRKRCIRFRGARKNGWYEIS